MNNLSLLIIALPFLITACGHQEATTTNQIHVTADTLVQGTLKDKESSEVIHGKNIGKPSAPISLEYSFEGKPILGQPLNVFVKLKGSQQKDSVKASLKYSPSLIAHNPIAKISFKSSSPKESEVVTITPTENGIYFININASTIVNGQTMYKAFTIPVEVGSVNWKEYNKPEGNLKNDSQGGKVISFPAAE